MTHNHLEPAHPTLAPDPLRAAAAASERRWREMRDAVEAALSGDVPHQSDARIRHVAPEHLYGSPPSGHYQLSGRPEHPQGALMVWPQPAVLAKETWLELLAHRLRRDGFPVELHCEEPRHPYAYVFPRGDATGGEA